MARDKSLCNDSWLLNGTRNTVCPTLPSPSSWTSLSLSLLRWTRRQHNFVQFTCARVSCSTGRQFYCFITLKSLLVASYYSSYLLAGHWRSQPGQRRRARVPLDHSSWASSSWAFYYNYLSVYFFHLCLLVLPGLPCILCRWRIKITGNVPAVTQSHSLTYPLVKKFFLLWSLLFASRTDRTDRLHLNYWSSSRVIQPPSCGCWWSFSLTNKLLLPMRTRGDRRQTLLSSATQT